ncbi:GtrA family protein [Brucella tritici]|uniref:GtrA family protein n=1 Tax=Brucella tritici TaxID=94626 RepID=UPI0031F30C6B
MLKRFPLFVSGSAMGAVIDYVVTLTASDVLHFRPAVALALAMIISGSVVFFFHVRVTFKYSTEKLLHCYILFMGWTCLIFLLRALLLQTCLHLGLRLAIALVIAICLVSIVNFAISSVVIFAKTPS